jgi:hypothetical protein
MYRATLVLLLYGGTFLAALFARTVRITETTAFHYTCKAKLGAKVALEAIQHTSSIPDKVCAPG